jgi:hypothetical protein
VKITYLRKILRGLRYCSLPKLIDRHVEISSLETFESDLFAILGGDLPADSRLVSPDKRHLEIALAKYGIIDVQLSISSRHLAACSLINSETLRELGFISTQEEKEYVSQNTLEADSEDIGLLDLLVEDVEKNEAILKLFLKITESQKPRLSLKLADDYFPQTFVVEDACLTNSSYVWLNKHFYL